MGSRQPSRPLVQLFRVPVDAGDESVQARLIGRFCKLTIDARDGLVLGDHQPGEIFAEVAPLRLAGKQVAKIPHGVLHHHRFTRVQQLLNDRPRKRLGYRSPNEVLASRLPGCTWDLTAGKLKIVGIAVIVLIVVIVVLQNTQAVDTKLLFFTVTMPNAALLFGTLIIGFAIGVLTAGHIVSRAKRGSAD
jgi:putative membrane protein